jgi:hypothetical protein
MDEQALNSLIKQRVEEAVTNVQTDMLKHMDRIYAETHGSNYYKQFRYFSKISKRKSTRIIRNKRDEF